MKPTLNRLKLVNAFTLKVMAMALMLCDHMWATVIPGATWMTSIGWLFPSLPSKSRRALPAPIISKDILGGSFCLP